MKDERKHNDGIHVTNPNTHHFVVQRDHREQRLDHTYHLYGTHTALSSPLNLHHNTGAMKDIWSFSILDSLSDTYSEDENNDRDINGVMVPDSVDTQPDRSDFSRKQRDLYQIDLSSRGEADMEVRENPWTKAVSNYATRKSKDNYCSSSSPSSKPPAVSKENQQNLAHSAASLKAGAWAGRSTIRIYDLNPFQLSSDRIEILDETLLASPVLKKTSNHDSSVDSKACDNKSLLDHLGALKNVSKKKRPKKEISKPTKKIVFGKIPRNIQPTSAFPIVQGLYNQAQTRRSSGLQVAHSRNKKKLVQTNPPSRKTSNVVECHNPRSAISDLSDDSLEEPSYLYSVKRNYIDLTNPMSSPPPTNQSLSCSLERGSTLKSRSIKVEEVVRSDQTKSHDGRRSRGRISRQSEFERRFDQDVHDVLPETSNIRKREVLRHSLDRSDTTDIDQTRKKHSVFRPLRPNHSIGGSSSHLPLQTLPSNFESPSCARSKISLAPLDNNSSSPCSKKALPRVDQQSDLSELSYKASTQQQRLSTASKRISENDQPTLATLRPTKRRVGSKSVDMPGPTKTMMISGTKLTLWTPSSSSQTLDNQGDLPEKIEEQEAHSWC